MGTVRDMLRQMKSFGKLLVSEDLDNFGSLNPLDHWQYGIALWYFSEMLLLLDTFFPLEKELEKARINNKIKILKEKQNAVKQVAQNSVRDPFRGIRRRHT